MSKSFKLFSPIVAIFTIAAIMLLVNPFSNGAAEAGVRVKMKKTYYNVRGTNGKDLSIDMVREGRKHITLSHAIAATRYDFDYSEPKIVVEDGKCVVKQVDVTLNLEYIYPRWLNRKKASSRMRKNWSKFWRELQRHEQQHGKIAKKAAKALEKEIRTFHGNTAFGCRDMGRFAGYKLSRILRKTRQAQKAFDRREYSNASKISKLQHALYKSE